MTGGIFLLQHDGQLIEMKEHAYDSEDLLQGLLARYPSLLAGDQIGAEQPRRWLLVRRESGVPAELEGPDRWAIDHVFLDQDAVPTLVEVKRSTDTRIRREVVGQMLDYAANAVVYWPAERIRAEFEANCAAQGVDAGLQLEGLLTADLDVELFWQKVKTNLQAGRVRLVFVADEVPAELRRIVEFLNGQMDPAEVLAVEIKQYVGQDLRTLVPRVIGQTVKAQQTKSESPRAKRQWDEQSFFQELERTRGAAEAVVARRILQWAQDAHLRIWWGQGKQYGSFFPLFDYDGTTYWLVSVWTSGTAEVQFQMMQTKPPFGDEPHRQELCRRLNLIPGVAIPADAIGRRPSIRLALLTDDAALNKLLQALDWVIEEIKATK